MDARRTPLHGCHLKYGGKMVDYAGWALPVQFSGILKEHEAVRTAAGLFDVSHMGEIDVSGEDARRFLEYVLTADLSNLETGMARYSPMCNPHGGVIDDVIVYQLDPTRFMVVVNAANARKDFDWLKRVSAETPAFRVEVKDVSDSYAQLSLQGPNSQRIMDRLGAGVSEIGVYRFAKSVKVLGVNCLAARTGYTGEDGFELFCRPEEAPLLWEGILQEGDDLGCVPVGLGARDTLRFEACLPLYGQELTEETTPLEAGLGKFVSLEKPDFIGRAALLSQAQEGVKKRLVGFEMIEKGIPRHGHAVYHDGRACGTVTSGGLAPSTGKFVGLCYAPLELRSPGLELQVEVRGKRLKAKVVKTPFYRRPRKS